MIGRPARPGAAERIAPRGPGGLAAGLIAAVLAALATLATALALAAGRLAEDWSGPQAERATLHVLAAAEAVEAQARAALEVLRTTPAVRAVRVVEVEEQRALLAPWFGGDAALDGLPLPLIIEVEADPAALDRDTLAARLAAEAPGAVYDDHAAWRAPLAAWAERLAGFALAALAALAAALAAAVGLAAAAAVAAHAPAARTLRLLGARDGFIAAGFVRPLARRVALAAAAGTAVGLAILATLPAGAEAGFFLVGLGPRGLDWLFPLAVAPAAAAIAWAAAALAARRALRRWS